MIVASDITTLEQRGKYNGFIGAMVGLGNGIGPLIGGALTQKASWRWCFWFISPVIVAVMVLIAIVIPPSNVRGKAGAKIRMIDWLGLLINIAAVVLILVSFFLTSRINLSLIIRRFLSPKVARYMLGRVPSSSRC